MQKIHETSLFLMEEVGMKIYGRRALDILSSFGAKVLPSGITKIPSDLVEKALESVPKSITLYTGNGIPYITIDKEKIFFGTHADQLELVDPYSSKIRKFLKEDIKLMASIGNSLKNIDFILSVGMAADVPAQVQSQISFIETAKYFKKPINFSTNDIDGLKDIIEIAAAIAGGQENLKAKPFIFNYCEPIPPMTHPNESTEKLLISAQNGIPVIYMPYCMMGGTAPVSFSGALAQCNAEVLTGLVITQFSNEGSPFIYGAMPSIFDMRTTIGSYGAPEFHMLVAAASELAYWYGIPFYGTAGCTDAKVIDEQAVAEVTMSCFSSLLSKADVIHDVGVMDHCNSVSPSLVVLADEIIEMLKHFVQGVRVDDTDLALAVIKEVGHGGHYLENLHTANNFKSIWYSSLFTRKMHNKNCSEVNERIKEKISLIMLEGQSLQSYSVILKEYENRYMTKEYSIKR